MATTVPRISLDELMSQIRARYDSRFLDELIALPDIQVLAFGGTIRDILLGKKWKDIDLRVICKRSRQEQIPQIKAVLEKYGTIIQTILFQNDTCTVFRTMLNGSKDLVIDSSLSDSDAEILGDFTVCSIYLDLKTGELIEQGPTCLEDFDNRLIRPLGDPLQRIKEEPQLLLRAIKLASQTGFSIHKEFSPLIRGNKELVGPYIKSFIEHIKTNGKDSYAEYMLGNIFGSLKSDAETGVALLHEYGLFNEFCKAGMTVCENCVSDLRVPEGRVLQYKGTSSLEQRLSFFLSDIAKTISTQPSKCFEDLKRAFALDTDRSDGNEFVVNPTGIQFQP